MPDAIPIEHLAYYSLCSEMYRLAVVEDVRPSISEDLALETAMRSSIGELLGRSMSLEELLGKFEMALEQQLVLVKYRHKSESTEALIAEGKRFLAHFYSLEQPSLRPKEIYPKVEGHLKLWKLGGREADAEGVFSCQLDIVEATQIGWLKVWYRGLSLKEVVHNLRFTLGSILAGYSNVWVMVFSRNKGQITRRKFILDRSDKEWAAKCATAALRGIEREEYRPCDPESPWCSKSFCQWFRSCRGRGRR